MQAAAQSLVGRADAITVIGDNTAVTALESIVKIADQNKIPALCAQMPNCGCAVMAAKKAKS